jgi:hypothetical protein
VALTPGGPDPAISCGVPGMVDEHFTSANTSRPPRLIPSLGVLPPVGRSGAPRASGGALDRREPMLVVAGDHHRAHAAARHVSALSHEDVDRLRPRLRV